MTEAARYTTVFDADINPLSKGTREALDKLNQFTRDAQGRLRDAHGRFVGEGHKLGEGAGKGFGAGFSKALKIDFSGLGQRISELGRSLTVGLTAPLTALGTIAVKTAVDFDSLKRGLVAVAGSTQAADAQFKSLREVAKLPGLGLKEALQGSINLQAAGLSAEMAERSLKAFGNALATVGKGKAELEGVNLALSQIANKSKVSAEEINQIAERVPQIRQIMQKAFGTADTEVLQERGLAPMQFISAVVAELEKLPKVTGGAKNAFENLSDSIQIALLPLGNAILVPLTKAIETITPMIERLSERFASLSPNLQGSIITFGGFLALLGPAAFAVSALVTAIGTIGVPLVAATAGVGALAAAFTFNLGGIRDFTEDVVSDLRGIWERHKSEVLSSVTGTYNQIRDGIKAAFAAILASARETWPALKDFIAESLRLISALISGWAQTNQLIFGKHNEGLLLGVKVTFDEMVRVIRDQMQAITTVFRVTSDIITGNWRDMWEMLKDMSAEYIVAIKFDIAAATGDVVGMVKYWHDLQAAREKPFRQQVPSRIDVDSMLRRRQGSPEFLTPGTEAFKQAMAGAGVGKPGALPSGGGAAGTGGGKRKKGSLIDLPLAGDSDSTAIWSKVIKWTQQIKENLMKAAAKTIGNEPYFDNGKLIFPIDLEILMRGLEMPDVKAARDESVLKPFVDLSKIAKPEFDAVAAAWKETLGQMAYDFDRLFSDTIFDAITGRWDGILQNLLSGLRDILGMMATEMIRASLGDKLFSSTGGGGSGGVFGSIAKIGVGLLGSFFGGAFSVNKLPAFTGLKSALPAGFVRDSGGPVLAGRAYANLGVPELFIPSTSGNVVPVDKYEASRSVRQGPVTVIVNMPNVRDYQSFKQSQSQFETDLMMAAQRSFLRNS